VEPGAMAVSVTGDVKVATLGLSEECVTFV
jgi:hypothetical protein